MSAYDDVLAHYGLSKFAKARWQREEPGLSPEQVRSRRESYYQPGPSLSEEQLFRQRHLRDKQLEQMGRSGIVQRPEQSLLGPHFTEGTPVVPLTTGPHLREAAAPRTNAFDKEWWGKFMPEKAKALGQLPGAPLGTPAMDPAIAYAAARHELGEKAQAMAATSKEVGSRALASHLGEVPNIAERLPLFQDPEAGRIFDALRAHDKDDAFTQKMMRRFGHTPSAPMPLGGKTHARLADAVLKYKPTSVSGQHFRNPFYDIPADIQRHLMPKEMTELLPRVPLYPTALPEDARTGLRTLENYAQKAAPFARKLPASFVDRIRPIMSRIFNAGHVQPGGPREIMKHFSSF